MAHPRPRAGPGQEEPQLDSDGERRPVSPHLRAPARLPEAVSLVAAGLDDPGRPLAGGRNRDRPARRRGDRRHRGRPGHDGARLARRRDLDRRGHQGGADARPPDHLRPAGARDREGHARGAVRAPAAALVRLLRPPPDGPADVARDHRPAVGALLPRLRPDLLLPARAHRRLGDGRALRRRVEAGVDRARDHAADRRRRLPLQPRLASGPARGAAEARRRRDGDGGVDRRRPRRQGVRAGGPPPGAVRARLRRRLRADRPRFPPARALRPAALLPAAACAGRRPPRRGADGRERLARPVRVLRLQPPARDADRPAPQPRNVGGPEPASDRVRRADLRDHGRARGRRRPPRAPASCRPARARSASTASPSATRPTGPCSRRSTSCSRRVGPWR